jgi:hypothetical protein
MIDSVKKVMGAGHYYFEPTMASSNEAIGMAIFSKYPIKIPRALCSYHLKGAVTSVFMLMLKRMVVCLRMYSVHLQSISFDPQDYKYLGNLVSSKGKPISAPPNAWAGKVENAFQKRSDQVFIIKEHAKNALIPIRHIRRF